MAAEVTAWEDGQHWAQGVRWELPLPSMASGTPHTAF